MTIVGGVTRLLFEPTVFSCVLKLCEALMQLQDCRIGTVVQGSETSCVGAPAALFAGFLVQEANKQFLLD